jgi:hypothetical protein
MAASLRSTGWMGTFGSSPSHYSEPRGRRATLERTSLALAWDLMVRFPGKRLARRHGHEGLLWVEADFS